ncbi:CAP domain-containing protein [Natrinema soli]|uniref:CAP domain-containing protein n=1 Tax=Natrinema soli TaxID=1930624 RepID=A0ABD5SNJ2_9EURY|nr:CAP domain-containing protein [Natrinema soli]
MKRYSNAVVTATVAAILALSMIGVGAAAPVHGSSATDTMDTESVVSGTETVTQSESVTTVSTHTETGTESVDTGASGDDALESVPTDLRSGLDADLPGSTFLEDLLDDLGESDDSVSDSDDSDGNETTETGDDEPDESTGDGDESDEGAEDETTDDSLDRSQVERDIHEAVNEERTARGLEPLSFDTELRDIARGHSEDMAERGYFSHVDPEGNDFADRYDAAGYECRANGYTGGENIAQTWYDTPVRTDGGETVQYETERELANGIVDQWMNSSGHRENILATQWENEGIGVYVTDDGRVYATQNFC